MSDEYLWNRTGEPDEEVARLERLLGPLRYRSPHPAQRPARRPATRWFWTAAAALLLCGTAGFYALNRGANTAWQTADGRNVRAGHWIESGSVESPLTGHIEIDPRSRLEIVASGENEQRFHLQRGTIHALIWAPPGRFVVDTPSAKTVDLGCRYTLRVGDDGAGLVTVETGWVAFEWQNRESFIPAGAACATRPRLGPGTPWFTDAPAELKHAIEAFDTRPNTAALRTALHAARQRDALTLWHLMIRTHAEVRAEVFDRFRELVHLPAAVTRDAVLRGDAAALNQSWNALGLGSTEWWREWKRKW